MFDNAAQLRAWQNISIAHRAGKSYACENTLQAMQASIARGVKAIEIDVQLTLDRVPVVVHNVRLPQLGLISQLRYEQLQHVKLDFEPERFPSACETARMPRLEQLLDLAVQSGVLLLIDAKDFVYQFELADTIVRLVTERNMIEQVLVGSFDPFFLHRVRREPRIATVLFTFPRRGLTALCNNRYVLPHSIPEPLCWAATSLDAAVDWFVSQPFMSDFCGASAIGHQWMALDDAKPIDFGRGELKLVYVVNALEQKRRFQKLGISMMTDCDGEKDSCYRDLLDPIVQQVSKI